MSKKAVGLRFDPELIEAIDVARGDVSRNRWIERAIEHELAAPAAQDRAARSDRVQRGRKAADGQAPDLPKIAPRHWAR
jgi:hypothetical protein